MSKTEIIIGDIYDAWRAQDLEWLASYLPEDFCHTVYIPAEIHPLGGACRGKRAALTRMGLIVGQFEFLRFDTSDLMVKNGRAGVEIPIHYRHRETGTEIETKIVNFWTFEDGWPVKLDEYHDIARIQAFTAQLLAALTPV
jgi:ketosteroid isomerase-like protein